jgi:hypothetical protein
VTGKPAVFRRITLDEMWANADDRVNNPWSLGKKRGDGSRTIRENISAFWRIMRDDIFELDLGWIRSVHPETYTLERWMRETRYDGKNQTTLKSRLDNSNPWGFNPEWLAQL